MTLQDFTFSFLERTRGHLSQLGAYGASENKLTPEFSGSEAARRISELVAGSRPAMIGRFGENELEAVRRGLSIRSRHGVLKATSSYLRGERAPFWYSEAFRTKMANNAGFFPPDANSLLQFADRMLIDVAELDLLGSWLKNENKLREFFSQASIVPLSSLEPYLSRTPWSKSLAGQRVLVVHPFVDTIRKQYERRELLFEDDDVLPDFSLLTLKAVQSIAYSKTRFSNWFEALSWMENEIEEIDFDVAIIGAGAYGFPLAAFVKRLGRKAVHLGGATQILFGIKGKRWENVPQFMSLFNQHWVRPQPSETPKKYLDVESGCYW